MTTEKRGSGFFLEAHFVHGLAPFVMEELRHLLKHKLSAATFNSPTSIRFKLIDDLELLHQMRTVTTIYLGRTYAIARPKALLGHQHFHQLLKQVAWVCAASPHHTFRSFRIEAAGADSAIFRRIRHEIVQNSRLLDDPESGELTVRIFPEETGTNQWIILCRLTPRPLSARSWRVHDYPGAINATIAACMVLLAKPQPTDRVLNLMCGSGTLLIERLLQGCAAIAVGCDTQIHALAAATTNLSAAGLIGQVRLVNEDAAQLSCPSQNFDLLLADLPWGQLVGDHAKNAIIYPRVLQEAARIASSNARFVLITTEVRLLEETVQKFGHLWQIQEVIKVQFKNLHPRIYLLQRRI